MQREEYKPSSHKWPGGNKTPNPNPHDSTSPRNGEQDLPVIAQRKAAWTSLLNKPVRTSEWLEDEASAEAGGKPHRLLGLHPSEDTELALALFKCIL